MRRRRRALGRLLLHQAGQRLKGLGGARLGFAGARADAFDRGLQTLAFALPRLDEALQRFEGLRGALGVALGARFDLLDRLLQPFALAAARIDEAGQRFERLGCPRLVAFGRAPRPA